jgi:hypothetical protein
LDVFDLEKVGSLKNKKSVPISHHDYSDFYLKSSDNKYRKVLRNQLTPQELELYHTEKGGSKKL